MKNRGSDVLHLRPVFDVVIERCLGRLHDADVKPVPNEDVRHRAPDPSANAPCTRTTFLTDPAAVASVARSVAQAASAAATVVATLFNLSPSICP